MKTGKRIAIWAAVMVAAVFCINLVGTVVVKTFLANLLMPSLAGYANKGDQLLHPTLKEPDEKNKTNGLSGLAIRSLLDDTRIMNGTNFWANFIFMNVKLDQSVILYEPDGMSSLSKGTFVVVYTSETGESIDHIRYAVGLIPVNGFCELDCAETVFETLEQHPDAVIRVDSYSISDFLVQPASITILDGNDSVIGTFDCPCSGEIIQAENVFVYDDNDPGIENDFHGFYNEMKVAYLGERRSDKAAEKLMDEVDFAGGEQRVEKSGYGLGHYLGKSYEVKGGYAMINVFDYDFSGSVILYSVIICFPVTFLTFFLGRKKKNDF